MIWAALQRGLLLRSGRRCGSSNLTFLLKAVNGDDSMINGIRINKAEGNRESDGETSGLKIDIKLDKVEVKGQEITMDFSYTANYLEKVGTLKMEGTISAVEDAKLAKEVEERWKKEKRLPDKFAELILNTINYACSTNGVLVARVVGLSPPIVPPKIAVGTT